MKELAHTGGAHEEVLIEKEEEMMARIRLRLADEDSDGRLTRKEWLRYRHRGFMDNKDLQEIAWRRMMRDVKRYFKELDTDGDGTIDLSELRNQYEAFHHLTHPEHLDAK